MAKISLENMVELERLDRGLCNLSWRMQFQQGSISYLSSFNSNHCPFLLQTTLITQNQTGNPPFKFLTTWLTNNSFKEIVKDC